jgi:tRNA threonylcarbamoyl adenosine modification protein (Sua5/YciO/YrdC/YwlC family)
MTGGPPTILSLAGSSREAAIAGAAAALRDGELVAIPTDTVYGVAAHPSRKESVRSLFVVKGRDEVKPIPLLADGIASIEKAGAVLSVTERKLAARFWPGPLTLVLGSGSQADGWGEGFRVPAHDDILRLLALCGGLLRVTSANLSGDPPALTASQALAALRGRVRFALDGGRSPGGTASTVVRIENGLPVILRAGALGREEVMEACA